MPFACHAVPQLQRIEHHLLFGCGDVSDVLHNCNWRVNKRWKTAWHRVQLERLLEKCWHLQRFQCPWHRRFCM